MMTQLLIEHQRVLSARVDDLEEQIRELRTSGLQRQTKRAIIWLTVWGFLPWTVTAWIFRRVAWLRWA